MYYPTIYISVKCKFCNGTGNNKNNGDCEGCLGEGTDLETLMNRHVFTEDERDSEIIFFAVWVISKEGQMYQDMGMSAKKLLDTYRDRPFVKFDQPENQ